MRIASLFNQKGIPHAGFYARGDWEGEIRKSFTLHLLPSGETLPLCDRVTESWIPMGRFRYNPEALRRGHETVAKASPGDIIILDEIGLQELWGCVWADTLSEALRNEKSLILTVQHRNLREVIDRWSLTDAVLFDLAAAPWEIMWRELSSQLHTMTPPETV